MEANNFAEVWPHILLFDLLRYLIPASLFFVIFWVIARGGLMHLFIQRMMPQSRQLWKEFAWSMSTVVIFSLVGFGIYSAEHAGLTRIYHRIDEYGIAYMVFSLAVAIVFHDFYFYWMHRLMHHKRIFKYVHRVHHESTNPSPWAAYAFHPWEALIQALVMPILVFTLPLHPLTAFLFLAYMIIRNVIGHLGFEIFPKGWTRNRWLSWTTAVTHHSLHHEHFHGNYGLYFTWWDRWMKTEHSAYHDTFDEVKSRPKACELKRKIRHGAAAVFIGLLCSQSVPAQDVDGQWITYHEQTGSPLSVIEITKSGNSIVGRVKQIMLEPHQGEDPVCTRCPGDRRNAKVIGMNFLWGLRQEGNVWTNGEILDPESGEVYNSRLWMEDENTLRVRGYAGPLDLFYRTQTWKREGPASDHSPVGLWKTIDDHWNQPKSVVEIKKVNGELKGFIRKIFLLPHEGPDPVCTECEGALKNTKVVGMRIIWDFRKDGGRWIDGKILDPGNGHIYTSAIWLIDADTLNVRGYLGPFYRSQVWRRMK
jgi:sterol desaturase/sphingolipid hydroxylase (fatty acid hydroxylase superfamily)